MHLVIRALINKWHSRHSVFAFIFIHFLKIPPLFFIILTTTCSESKFSQKELIKYRKQKCRSAKESESPADLFRPLAGVLGWPHATTSSRAAFQSFR